MKRGFALSVMTLFLMSFVSAYYGSYSSFSLSDLLDSIDSSTMILGGLFIIFFAMSNFALVRAFKGNKAVAGVVSFVVSLFAVYGLNKTGFDFEGLFYRIGFSEGLLYTLLPLVLLAGVIYLGIRFGFGITLMIFGGLLILITIFTEIIYENGIAIIFGICLMGIGFWLWRRKNPKLISESYPQESTSYAQKARELRAKQQYDYYKKVEEQKQAQSKGEARELRRQEAGDKKIKDRYIRRYGKRAWDRRNS